MTRILIVEYDPAILRGLSDNLQDESYAVTTAVDGETAYKLQRSGKFDLIVLDLMLPRMSGFELCRKLRAEGVHTPVLILTARSEESDRVFGLDLGADDYVTKPFSPRELVLRVKALLRRSQSPEEVSEHIRIGTLVVDVPRHAVRVQNKDVDLTATEFRLLTMLAQRRGRVLSREQLLRDVWEYDTAIDSRTVDTHMRRLREKLGPAARYLDTVRGVGYRFVDEG